MASSVELGEKKGRVRNLKGSGREEQSEGQ
jgi:hypothetical protein